MSPARTLGRRLAALAALALITAAAEVDVKKDKTSPAASASEKKLQTSALIEPRWSWAQSSPQPSCPPPDFFYESCHMLRQFTDYRDKYPQYHLQHDAHFRPVAGPRLPLPLPLPPVSRPQPPPPLPSVSIPQPLPSPRQRPSLVTFVAEEARPGHYDPWGQRGRGAGHNGGHRPDWHSSVSRDQHAWKERCYRLQRRDTRLENHILAVLNSRELRDCEESCNRDRRCISFNFRSDPVETVCELTDMDSYANIAQFRPIVGWDFYERDASSYCSGWDNDFFDQQSFGYAYCSARVQDNSLLNVNAIRRDITTRSLGECEQACRDERNFRCETFSFGVLPGGRAFSCHLTDLRISELSPRDIEPAPSFEIYDFHGNGRECDRPDDQFDFRLGALETSSGRPCQRGPCRIDRSGGYWYCFTDVNEVAWDYCCDPDSPCQREPRMDIDTCHVTQGRGLYRNAGLDTAWRPCDYRPGRYAYLTRNSTDHVVDDNDTSAANGTTSASGGVARNHLLETIDLDREQSKDKH